MYMEWHIFCKQDMNGATLYSSQTQPVINATISGFLSIISFLAR